MPNPTKKKLTELNTLQKQKVKEPTRFSRAELSNARKNQKIIGYFGHIQLGRPPHSKTLQPGSNQHTIIQKQHKKSDEVVSEEKIKRKYINWLLPDNFVVLKAVVQSYLTAGDTNKESLLITANISLQTLDRYAKQFQSVLANNECLASFENITAQMLLSTRKLSKRSLLSVEDIAFLKDIIIHRDEANNGMGRKEAIKLIGETSQCSNWITCTNHWNNLVRSGKLKELKGGGKVVKAQQSTTKRTQITVEQQLHWHTNIDCGIE